MKLNNKGIASGFLLMVLIAAVIAGIIIKGYFDATIITSRIQADQRKKTDQKIEELLKAKKDLEDLLKEVKSETSTIPRICAPGDTICNSQCSSPLTCRHTFSNGKTVQACEGDCTYVDGYWYKGGQVCSLGMECKK